jgi:hypothetical protein
MKRIYVYIFVCIIIGMLMLFKGSIRQLFSENLNEPSVEDTAWKKPKKNAYTIKTVLELHYFNTRRAVDLINEKISDLHKKKVGIKTLLISGSPKLPTNTYLRELAKQDWGIEEIRLHNTEAINIYALLNLIKANPEIQRILIWNNTWDRTKLRRIERLLPTPIGLELIQE